jgi:phenylacetate-CoA ligase
VKEFAKSGKRVREPSGTLREERVVNFYDLDPDRQQALAIQRALQYVRTYVGRYHPFLRKFYREAGVDLAKVRTLDDFRRLPLLEKKHLQSDPLMFILRPKTSGSPPLPAGYDTEPLPKATLVKYAIQAASGIPRDPVYRVRRDPLRERMRRIGALEWLPIHTHASTGSSGEPTPVTFTAYDIRRVLGEIAALVIQPKDPPPGYLPFDWQERRMSLFPGAPHMAFYGPVLAKVLVGTPSFETFGGAVIPTERQISTFVNGEFHSLLAIPSYLVYWLRKAIALQKDGKAGPLKTLRRVVLGAEPVSEALREYIRGLAEAAGAEPGMRIVQTMGMTEMKWTNVECCEHSGVHLNPKYYYYELLHPVTRQPVGPREPGVLVFTHVGWRGTVLVRYWTGDLIKGGMTWDRCEWCGWTFPRIFPPVCRVEKDFTKLKGARVDLSLLTEVVRDTQGVRNFQLSLESEDGAAFSRDQLIVHVVAEAGISAHDLERRLNQRIKDHTEVSPDRLVFEDDEPAFEKRLFARSSVKAEYVVERRLDRL